MPDLITVAGRNPVPVTVTVRSPAPAATASGASVATDGAGLWTVKASVAEPPPGAGFSTVRVAARAVARLAAGIDSDSTVGVCPVTVSPTASRRAVVSAVKPVPVTSTVSAAAPAETLPGVTSDNVTAGLSTSMASGAEVPPPGAGVTARRLSAPAAASADAGMVTVSVVAVTPVGVSPCVPSSTEVLETKPAPVSVTTASPLPATSTAGAEAVRVGSGLRPTRNTVAVAVTGAGPEVVAVTRTCAGSGTVAGAL